MQQHLSLLQDVRGCMMRFEALTPEIVAGQSEDCLTYDEMKAVLAECGMDIEKVVECYNNGQQDEVVDQTEEVTGNG